MLINLASVGRKHVSFINTDLGNKVHSLSSSVIQNLAKFASKPRGTMGHYNNLGCLAKLKNIKNYILLLSVKKGHILFSYP